MAERLARRRRARRTFVLIGASLAATAIVSICIGAVGIGPLQVAAILAKQVGVTLPWSFETQQESVLIAIRLPRVLLGILVGGALAAAGAAMQGLYRSPLADPGLIGIGGGAAFGAVIAIVVGVAVNSVAFASLGVYGVPVTASLGALVAGVVIHRVASASGRAVVATMLLAGIALNAMLGAATGVLTFASGSAAARDITFWSLGSLGGATWRSLIAVAIPILLCMTIMPRLSRGLDALALGESEAGHLGVDVARLRRAVLLLVAVAVGASVAVAGVIGFVGLVVPNLVRRWVGAGHRGVLIASTLLGSTLLLLADLVARTAFTPAELPIGVVTAAVGGPCFLWLLLRDRGALTR